MSARPTVALLVGGWLLTACQGAPPAERRVGLPEPSDELRESGPARFARTHHDFDWVAHDTEYFRLYAERGPGVEMRLVTLGRAADAALRQSRAYVGCRSATGRVSHYFVDSRERMGDLLGRTPGGSALPRENVAFFVASPNGYVPALVHELAHLEAWEAFGERPLDEAWLDEAAWRAHVAEADTGVELDWEALRDEGCEASPEADP